MRGFREVLKRSNPVLYFVRGGILKNTLIGPPVTQSGRQSWSNNVTIHPGGTFACGNRSSLRRSNATVDSQSNHRNNPNDGALLLGNSQLSHYAVTGCVSLTLQYVGPSVWCHCALYRYETCTPPNVSDPSVQFPLVIVHTIDGMGECP